MTLKDELQARRELAERNLKALRGLYKLEEAQRDAREGLDASLMDIFREHVKDKTYFEIKDVDCLGLEYDILFVLGKKNVGKTTQIYRLFQELDGTNDKAVFGRVSRKELEVVSGHFNADEECPFFVRSGKYLYSKATKQEHGWIVDFKYCQALGGGMFEDVKYIIFDEIIPYDPRRIITPTMLENWAAFASTVVRNKQGVKIFLFGNFRKNNNDILGFYGISPDDEFRYIERKGCKILFINTGDLYSGIAKQASVALHGSPSTTQFLENNSLDVLDDMSVSGSVFRKMKNIFNIMVTLPGTIGSVVVRFKKGEDPDGSTFHAIQVKNYEPYDQFSRPILTMNRLMADRRFNLNYVVRLQPYLNVMCSLINSGAMLWYDEESTQIMNILYEAWIDEKPTFEIDQ